jgi:agmatinase
LDPLKKVAREFGDRPIYITLDIDVLDPAFACGTGTPEPGGCMPDEIFDMIVFLKNKNLVGMDIVEVSPIYDPSERTPILAAKIIREALLAFL